MARVKQNSGSKKKKNGLPTKKRTAGQKGVAPSKKPVGALGDTNETKGNQAPCHSLESKDTGEAAKYRPGRIAKGKKKNWLCGFYKWRKRRIESHSTKGQGIGEKIYWVGEREKRKRGQKTDHRESDVLTKEKHSLRQNQWRHADKKNTQQNRHHSDRNPIPIGGS